MIQLNSIIRLRRANGWCSYLRDGIFEGFRSPIRGRFGGGPGGGLGGHGRFRGRRGALAGTGFFGIFINGFLRGPDFAALALRFAFRGMTIG